MSLAMWLLLIAAVALVTIVAIVARTAERLKATSMKLSGSLSNQMKFEFEMKSDSMGRAAKVQPGEATDKENR